MPGSGHDALRKRAGITYRQLDHWCREGYVPDLRAPQMGPAGRQFTRAQEARIVMLGRLTRAGFRVGDAVALAPFLETLGTVPLAGTGLRLVDDTVQARG